MPNINIYTHKNKLHTLLWVLELFKSCCENLPYDGNLNCLNKNDVTEAEREVISFLNTMLFREVY